jgi:hypothetical protein
MLKKQIGLIKSWSESTGIPVYEGEIPEKFPNIKWEKKEKSDSLLQFLDLVKKIKPKFIILDSTIYEYGYSDSEIKDIIKSIEKEDLEKFNSLHDPIKSKHGEYLRFSVSFIENGCSFEFEEWAEWADNWSDFTELAELYGLKEFYESTYAISDQILKYAKKLARTPLFKRATNKPQREIAATAYVKSLKFNKVAYVNLERIAEYADSIIKLEVGDDDL